MSSRNTQVNQVNQIRKKMFSTRIKQDENHPRTVWKLKRAFVVQKEQYFNLCIYEKSLSQKNSRNSNADLSYFVPLFPCHNGFEKQRQNDFSKVLRNTVSTLAFWQTSNLSWIQWSTWFGVGDCRNHKISKYYVWQGNRSAHKNLQQIAKYFYLHKRRFQPISVLYLLLIALRK